MKLYEITDELKTLYSIPVDGDIEGVNWEAFNELLQELNTKIIDKIDNTVNLLKSWQLESDMLESQALVLIEEAKKLKNKSRVRETAINSLKEYLKYQMIGQSKQKIKTSLYTVYIQKGRVSVEVYDEDVLPEGTYRKIPEKAKIEKLLISGETVKGARLQEGKEFLQIR